MSMIRRHLVVSVFILMTLCVTGLRADDAPKSRARVPSFPPDIDQVVPPTKDDLPCPLPEVLNAASTRVQELVKSMQRISATEAVEFSEVDASGGLRKSATTQFSYVADIREVRPGQLSVEEYRNDRPGADVFPSRLATTGTAAFALMFHPLYVGDFSATCEGLADFHGRRAWQVRLAQTRINNFRGYRLANRYFPVLLKARAWIDAESYEVLRLETDLLKQIPEIPLRVEHVIIDYGAVSFPNRKLQLWLPQTAEIYMDYRGRLYHHRHSFSGFLLFWVDTEQTVKTPDGL